MRDTMPLLEAVKFPSIRRSPLQTLQVNLGYKCNLSCLHCHVAAGPKRTEMMEKDVIDQLIEFMDVQNIKTLDVTGGSPEMNPHFRYFLSAARELGVHCMDRLNPTIIEEPGYDWVPEFLAQNQVEVVASLPCYLEDNVNAQRGNGVFEASVTAIKKLNELGYGKDGSGLTLNLVYNPLGPSLPPAQEPLEAAYKDHLGKEFGLEFNQLFTLANMPIKRFGSMLVSKGEFEDYMNLLKDSYNKDNLADVMCRNLISVDYQGHVHDCDFNQMLDMPLAGGQTTHISDLLHTNFTDMPIAVAGHCFGCTAGQGSSCGGALQ